MNNEIVVKLNEVVILEQKLQQMKEIEKQIKQVKEDLKVSMVEADLKKWETPNGTKITLIEDGLDEEIEVKEFNANKFYEENDDLVKKFDKVKKQYLQKETEYYQKEDEYKIVTGTKIKKGRKGYVRITLPKTS